jgi:1-acyl-sn-glycerol-3-phosphate acyltransferase
VERIDVGWYGAMTFLPHLWSLMKRGRTQCRIVFGDAIETTGKDRKTLAAETHASVQKLLASVGGAEARIGPSSFETRASLARRDEGP